MSDDTQRGLWTSASGAERDSLCPAAHTRQRGLAEPPSTPDADSGNRVHSWLAGKDVKLTREEQEIADACAEIELHELYSCLEVSVTLANLRFAAAISGATFYREHRFWVNFAGGDTFSTGLKHSGQVDLAVVLGKKAFISDRKSLWGDHAESDRNLQLRDLACLLWANAPGIEEVYVLLVQPRVNRHPKPCVYNLNDLAQAWSELRERVRASNDPNSKAVAGEKQCKYCRAAAAGKCGEYQAWIGAAFPAVVPPLPICTAREWTPEQRTLFQERKRMLRQFIDDRDAECVELLEQDKDAIPGFALEEGDSKTTITNPQEVFNRFLRFGGNQDAFMPTVTVWTGKLRKALAGVLGLKGAALGFKFEELLDGCSETKRNKPSIVKVKE